MNAKSLKVPPDPKRGDPTTIPTGETRTATIEKVWWWNGRRWYLTEREKGEK